MSSDNKQQPPTKMFLEQFCSKNGCTPQEKFYLQKVCKGEELTESQWKKKLEDGNKS